MKDFSDEIGISIVKIYRQNEIGMYLGSQNVQTPSQVCTQTEV